MAKMPQIPQPDYSQRPDGQVGRATLPSMDGGVTALNDGARVLEDTATGFARQEAAQQKALQDALDAKQAIVDTVTATRGAGDFEEKLRGVSDQLQTQFVDNPEKAPAAMLVAARQLADGAVNAAPNSAVGLALAQKTASATNQMMTSMHAWAQGRMTHKAKSDLTVLQNQATHGAESVSNPTMLSLYAQERHAALDPLYDKLHGDPEFQKKELDRQMAKAWVTANSARDPVGTSKFLDEKNGFLDEHLTSDDREHGRTQAEASLNGMGKYKQMQVLKEGIDLTGNAYDLLRKDEWKPGVALDLQQALEQKKQAITLDPNMKEDARQKQLKSLDLQSKTIAALDMVNRKQTGFDPTDSQSEDVRTKINEDYQELFKGDAVTKDLSAVIQFRHDLATAAAANIISRSTFNTMDKAVSYSLPKALATEASNTWGFAFSKNWRTPRQAGNAALNEYFQSGNGKGLGAFTETERNAAREYYIDRLSDASERQQTVDKALAKTMAIDAADFVKKQHR